MKERKKEGGASGRKAGRTSLGRPDMPAADAEMLAGILDALEDGVHVVGAGGTVLYANRVVREEYGEPDGRRCHEYFHGFSEGCEACQLEEVIRAGVAPSGRWPMKEGRRHSFLKRALQLSDGSVAQLCLIEDQMRLNDLGKSLQASSEMLRTLIDSSPLAILQFDAEGRVQLWNKGAERIFGWTEDEVLGMPSPPSLRRNPKSSRPCAAGS